MTGVYINTYSAVSNLGDDISSMFFNAIDINSNFLTLDDTVIKGEPFYFGEIKTSLPKINDEKYNTRCNSILLHCFETVENEINTALKKYDKNRVGVVIASTNSGVDEYALRGDVDLAQIGNPAAFLRKYLGLTGFFCGISSACTSGIKAFSTARRLLSHDVCDAVVVGGVDSVSRTPVYGFHSLEILSSEQTIPFSKNRNGINIGEGGALFLLEKEKASDNSIKLCGIGETSDAYHCATPEPAGTQASRAIEFALDDSGLDRGDIDYINLHGTGTVTNDLMEANAVFRIFGGSVPASSTKSQTGHCLGASAAIEAALCCAMLDKSLNTERYLLPHRYDNVYDDKLPALSLVKYGQRADNIKYVMNNAFGFGGSNAVMILGSD